MDLAWQELAEYEVALPEPTTEPAIAELPPTEPEPPVEPVMMPRSGTLFGQPEEESSEPRPQSRWPFRLRLAALVLAALGIAAYFTQSYWMPGPAVSLMASSDWAGRVSVLWNAAAISEQNQATLVIADGAGPLHTIRLSPAVIRAGWSQYDCREGKVTVTILAGTQSDSVTLQAYGLSYLPENYLAESGISK